MTKKRDPQIEETQTALTERMLKQVLAQPATTPDLSEFLREQHRPMLHIKLLMREEDGYAKDPTVFDEDGHLITASMTYDVNDAGSQGGVDVFIMRYRMEIKPPEVAKVLHKMADWVEALMQPSSIARMSRTLEQREEEAQLEKGRSE